MIKVVRKRLSLCYFKFKVGHLEKASYNVLNLLLRIESVQLRACRLGRFSDALFCAHAASLLSIVCLIIFL